MRSSIATAACLLAAIAILTSGCGSSESTDKIKIGFIVKQPEEPWFQLEHRFADDESEHGHIIEALTRRDPGASEAAMRQHLEQSVSYLLTTA